MTTGNPRGWIQTFTGKRFYPLAPRIEDVTIEDIAHGLASACRYGGQSMRFYSVAEHCVLMADTILHTPGGPPSYARKRQLALAALLHDSAEAYIGDMVRPLKHQPEMVEFRKAEARIELAVWERFNIPMAELHATVKVFDDRILLDEIGQLMRNPEMYTADLGHLKPLGINLHCWDPAVAETMFLDRYDQLVLA